MGQVFTLQDVEAVSQIVFNRHVAFQLLLGYPCSYSEYPLLNESSTD